MISKDLIINSNNDLEIKDGDFLIGQSDDQNIEFILRADKGQFYQFLLLGYGIIKKIYSPFRKQIEKRNIREEMKRDNYNLNTLEISDDFIITIDGDKIK